MVQKYLGEPATAQRAMYIYRREKKKIAPQASLPPSPSAVVYTHTHRRISRRTYIYIYFYTQYRSAAPNRAPLPRPMRKGLYGLALSLVRDIILLCVYMYMYTRCVNFCFIWLRARGRASKRD